MAHKKVTRRRSHQQNQASLAPDVNEGQVRLSQFWCEQKMPDLPDVLWYVEAHVLVLEDGSCRQSVALTSWHAVVWQIRRRRAIQYFRHEE